MNIREYLRQPYPLDLSSWKGIIWISILISLFMLIFQPFGLHSYEHLYKIPILLGYGGVTFIIASLNQLLLPRIFRTSFTESNWTIQKHIALVLWIFFTIGLGNQLYSWIVFPYSKISAHTIISFQLGTILVGIFPVSLFISLKHNFLLSKNQKSAKDMNKQLDATDKKDNVQPIQLSAENEKDKLELTISDLLFIESKGNYIQVHFKKNGRIENALLRSTLKKTENALSNFPEIIKCHRAFLVNTNKITEVKGNSQGYRLCFAETDMEVPVARNYSKSIREHIAGK